MKYVITDLGPVDWWPPGADVTGLYKGDTLAQLMAEGYIEEVKPKPKATPKRKAKKVNEVADGS
jgi:hypothetical protein